MLKYHWGGSSTWPWVRWSTALVNSRSGLQSGAAVTEVLLSLLEALLSPVEVLFSSPDTPTGEAKTHPHYCQSLSSQVLKTILLMSNLSHDQRAISRISHWNFDHVSKWPQLFYYDPRYPSRSSVKMLYHYWLSHHKTSQLSIVVLSFLLSCLMPAHSLTNIWFHYVPASV